MILDFVIVGLLLLDLFLTHSYLQLYQKRFPKNDWTVAEANPIIRYATRKLGLNQGMIVSGTIIMGIVMIVLVAIPTKYEASKWFFVGLYYSVNVHHFINNRAMKKLLKGGKK